MRKAFDLGVNWIDTAAIYGLGHSETLVSKALEGRRDEVIVATKCSLVWDSQGRIVSRLAKDSVRRECEASLRRLRTDRIDLYQIHWPNDDAHLEEGWGEIARLVQEGKVRHGGVSNFSPEQMERARPIHPIASLQPPYSMLRRSVETHALSYCHAHQIGVLAYSPMHSGLLSGSFDPQRLAPNDWRGHDAEFQAPALTVTLELVEALRPIAARHDKTVGQLAVAWVLRRSEITSAIVGARRPSQIEQLAGASGWRLTEDEVARIDALILARDKRVPSAETRFRA